MAEAPRAAVPLAGFTTFGVGGSAQWFTSAASLDEVRAARDWSVARGLLLFVLGGGSNLVIADTGITGLVMRMNLGGVRFDADGGDTLVRAGAGAPGLHRQAWLRASIFPATRIAPASWALRVCREKYVP